MAFRILSLLYTIVTLVRTVLYGTGILKARTLPVTVISVGNITAGGTGKTPLVMRIGSLLSESGLRCGVLSRGYGRTSHRPYCVDSAAGLGWQEIGDEPKMIAENIPCCLGIGADRFRIGALLVKKFGPMPLILDDGFAHRSLYRDLNILTVDAHDPWGKAMLPHGTRRELLRGIMRADMIVVTCNTGFAGGNGVVDDIRRRGFKKPVFTAVRTVECIACPDGKKQSVEVMRDHPFYVFSGIAHGDRFVSMARSLGLLVAWSLTYADHYPFDAAEMDQIRANAGGASLLTTEKDFWRLEDAFRRGLYYLKIALRIDQDKAFCDMVRGVIAQTSLVSV